MESKRGFTMVELLVVISLIFLLLAIMAPMSRALTQRADMDICQSNLHQLGVAQLSYLGDHGSRFMPFRQWLTTSYDYTNLALLKGGLIYPYVDNVQIFVCPAFKKVCDPRAIRSYVEQHSFGCTEGWPQMQPWGNGVSINTILQVKDTARLGLMTEEATWMVFGPDGSQYSRCGMNDADLCCPDWPNRDTIGQFHFPGPGPIDHQIEGLGNVDFVDGHVSAVHTTQTPYVVCQTWYGKPQQPSQ